MKKLILISFAAFLGSCAISQTPTKIGTSTNRVEVRNQLQIDGLSPTPTGYALALDNNRRVVNIPVSSSYTLPVATTSALGAVIVDGNTILIDGFGVIRGSNITLRGDITGAGNPGIATLISPNVVTNSKLAQITNAAIKGRFTAGTGNVEDLSSSQVKTILSLDQVNNTSDVSKPISAAVTAALALKANLVSPIFTGIPQVPTAANGTNTNQAASTAFVINAIAGSGGSGYTLPIANSSTLGGVKIGSGLAIDGSGILSATNSGVGSFNGRMGAIISQAGDYSFASLSGKPTTLSGYSITDAYPLVGNPSNFLTSVPAQSFSSLTGKPSTLSGYGISDPILLSTNSYVDPSFISTLSWSKIINRPSTVAGYGIGDAVTPTGAQTLTNKTIISPIGLVKADVGLSNVDNTSDATKNSSTSTLTNKTISGSNNTLSNIPESAVTNLTTDLNNKLSGGNSSLATLQADIIPLLSFGYGAGLASDTSACDVNSIYGSAYISGSNNLNITSINFIVQGSSPSVVVTLYYGPTLNSGGTQIITSGTTVTNTTTGQNVTAISNAVIPSGNYVWCKTTTVTTKPTYLSVTIAGYKTRN